MTICNDGTTVNCIRGVVYVSNGETYTRMGNLLKGPGGFSSMGVTSDAQAEAIVIGLHGGRRY